MNSLTIIKNNIIQASSPSSIEKVKNLTEELNNLPQAELEMSHLIHGGMYSRTVKLPKGAIITGALVKLATIIIITGHIAIYANDKAIELYGYNVFAASSGRKQAFMALEESYITMLFPTDLKELSLIEAQLTDETDLLLSRKQDNNKLTITGE